MSLTFIASAFVVAGAIAWAAKVVVASISAASTSITEQIKELERIETSTKNLEYCISSRLERIADKLSPPHVAMPEEYEPAPPMYLNDGETIEYIAGIVDGTEGEILGAIGLLP